MSLADTEIVYKLDPKGIKTKSLDGLVFILAIHTEDLCAATRYHDMLDQMSPIRIATLADLYKRECINLVDAHYGCYDMREGKLSLVVPRNINEICNQVSSGLVDDVVDGYMQTPASLEQEQRLIQLLTQQTALLKETVQQTICFIKEAHKGQRRYSGEPYYTHPMAVAEILVQESKDPDALLAALLHDVLEDTNISAAYLQSQYGSTIAGLVDGVTHLAGTSRKKKLTLKEKHEKLAFLPDLRSLQIKLVDRLHNLMTLGCRRRDKQVRVVEQTLAFYLPLARKMSLNRLAHMLEQQCQVIAATWSSKEDL